MNSSPFIRRCGERRQLLSRANELGDHRDERRLAAHDKSDCDACAQERSDELEAATRDKSDDQYEVVHDHDLRFKVVKRSAA